MRTILYAHCCLFFFLSVTCFEAKASGIDSTLQLAQRFYQSHQYVQAQKLYLQALRQAEIAGEWNRAAFAQRNIARCYYYLYDRGAALKWFYRYLKTLQKHKNDSLLGEANYFIAAMYIESENIDSSEKYSQAAIKMMRQNKDNFWLARTYCALSELYINTSKSKDIIEQYLRLAQKFAEMANDTSMLAFAAIKRYNYYFRVQKNYEAALKHISYHEKLVAKLGDIEALTNAYRAKAECLIMLRDTSAYTYADKWFRFKDSVFDAKHAEAVSKYETLYETQKKEAEILKQKQLLQQEQQKRNLFAIVLVSVLLLGTALFIIYRQKQQRQTELLLQQQQEKSLQEIFNAEQKERIRIARDLHDSIGQKLAVMRMILPKANGNKELEKVSAYLDETATEVRSISHNLIPEILNFGIVKALENLADRINSTESIRVDFRADVELQKLSLPKQTELSLYRIVQEILSNIIRHSKTEYLKIELNTENNFVRIAITDNGVGFNIESIDESKGLGWKNIFARIKLINGNIKIQSDINAGSQFLINIPIT